MKIIYPSAIALVCLLVQPADVSARIFTLPEKGSGPVKAERIKTAANFDAKGINMEVCPSGDCKDGKFMRLTVASLTELNAVGKEVVSVNKFKPKNSDWTDIAELEAGGVTVSSTTFVSTIAVGSTVVDFNLTAGIFQGNGTIKYGSQNLTVPAGALKFSVGMSKWPFADPLNKLTLTVKLDAKGPKGADIGKPAKKPKKSGNANVTIERVDLGDAMFMDAPTIVFLDGAEANVTNSSVVVSGDDTLFKWVFPSFKNTLYYDPVLGDESTTTENTTASAGGSESSSDDATKAPAASSASNLSLSSLMVAGLATLAYIFF